jgi:hypothetical protein
MPGHHPNPSVDNEAQFGRIVANLFREDGWKVLEEHREKNVAPDFSRVGGDGHIVCIASTPVRESSIIFL